ncbi:hypothetical protein A7981_10820 [Methylovorus sp. MM2]|uniref:PEP-CTERM sorting domain-containing protein n=1 Tax=Methylovorus sp. MM2 TaxID=1848038 RepID=UPI0007E1ACE5|nr:PEP-CTERM sorting domain-containing protein [Methylovorus sp. MM2]OAM51223.1 hypothetical protein A7981_10820 [Methylovorus sp. MM2]
MKRSKVFSLSVLAALLGFNIAAHADTTFLNVSETDVSTGAHKYTFSLAPGDYSLYLTDVSDSFSNLGVTVGQGVTNFGKLTLVGSTNSGVLNFTIPTGVSDTYSAIVYGKTSGSGDFTLVVSSVPEPATSAMLLAGLGLFAALRRREKS